MLLGDLSTHHICGALTTKDNLGQNSVSVRNLAPNSHNITAATTNNYQQLNKKAVYNTKYNSWYDIL